MVLRIAEAVASSFLPSKYWIHIAVAVVAILVIHAFAQGRTTTRERDLHARVILVTGGFTPLGLTLMQSLAQRGAHIIALSTLPVNSPRVEVLINLLRSTTQNEQIFAEECDLVSPGSVRAFCTRFLTGQNQRLDGILFTHEYQHIGSIFSNHNSVENDNIRKSASLATFLIITLLLPALLVAPVERDIRIITVINPFYAAAARSFSPSPIMSHLRQSTLLQEGQRSLRTVVLIRHLQRVLDALPSAQVPPTDGTTSTVPVVSQKSQRSNIVAVSVSPGISRSDIIAPFLCADRPNSSTPSILGVILYILLQPFLRILTKSSASALQSVLHVLFLPTPFKVQSQKSTSTTSTGKGREIPKDDNAVPEEVLKPGALYSECAVVNLQVTLPDLGKGKKTDQGTEERAKNRSNNLAEDEELGGETAGMLVWEAFEEQLSLWEKANPPMEKEDERPSTERESTLGDRETAVGPS